MDYIGDIVREQAEEAINKLGVHNVITAEDVAESVLRQAVYWEKSATNGEKLMFIRFFSPVIQREEVFLGNILFNTFLSKAFVRAIDKNNFGKIELIANDLENYYFLLLTKPYVAQVQLKAAFRNEVKNKLPDLFFGDEDQTRGIYGSLETMLDFVKANVEPFPVFIMPQAYAKCLEKAVRSSLLRKIEKSSFDRNPTSIMANLAFFYSHDGAEMQGPYLFLARLMLRYNVINEEDLRNALALSNEVELDDEASVKKIIEDSLKQKGGRTFSSIQLQKVLKKAVLNLGARVDTHPAEWLIPYVNSKFFPNDESVLVTEILEGVWIGYESLSCSKEMVDVSCRVCGARQSKAEDKSILMGQNTHKFHNQSSKQKDAENPKSCLRCAICTYLMVKLIGSEAVGQPQVPKTYNLIFHYGKHNDNEVVELARRIDLIWNLVREHRNIEQVHREMARQVKDLKTRCDREPDAGKKQVLAKELVQKEVELEQSQTSLSGVEENIYAACPWLKATGTSPVPAENCSLDALLNIQLSETKVERHVLGLGMGGYRMILFVLPQIRPPREAKEHDFAQRRFSDSRVTVTAVLSFLHQLCGCDGPFYYQSLPVLAPESFQRDTFYIRNKPINVQKALNEYEVITQLAWKLIWDSGSGGFVKKVILAEKLLEDPLEIFSAVMRDSAILGQAKGNYKRLPGSYRPDWKAYDLTEYTRFIQKLSKLQEVE
jgi:hypothetical protein